MIFLLQYRYLKHGLTAKSFSVPLYQYQLVSHSFLCIIKQIIFNLECHTDELPNFLMFSCTSSSITDFAPSAQQAAISVAVFFG
jgi:hypothetical protein